MEEFDDIQEKTPMRRMKQVFIVGGNHDHPSEFSKVVNKNIKILMDSDRNAEIEDIKFSVQRDPRYAEYGMVYLAFIVAEVDIVEKHEPSTNLPIKGKKIKRKDQPKKPWRM